jgi:uncharacterized hydrophobic protein (TIGR00271 family)
MGSVLRTSKSKPAIRFSRFLRSRWLIALGTSVTIGLGVFTLLGQVMQVTGIRASAAYGLAAVVFIPLLITIVERASAKPEGGWAFNLVRTDDSLFLSFFSGWLTFAGYLCLAALLSWGAGLHLNRLVEQFSGYVVEVRYLAIGLISLVVLNRLLTTRERWQSRTLIIVACILILLFIITREWISPGVDEKISVLLKTPSDILRIVAYLASTIWGISLILDHSDQIRRPERTMFSVLTVTLIGGLFVGFLAAGALVLYPGFVINNAMPLASLAAEKGELAGVIYLVAGVLIALMALDRTLNSSLRLSGAMIRDGFFPQRLETIHSGLGIPVRWMFVFALLSALVVIITPIGILVGVVAFSILWVTAFIVGKDLFYPPARLPRERSFKSPFYPLFPTIAIAICIFLVFGLPIEVWIIGSGWFALGVIYYFLYAQSQGIAARRQETVVGEIVPGRSESEYRVLVGVANPATAPSLIEIGSKLAKTRDGQVLVLQVVVLPEQMPAHLKKETAREKWHALAALVDEVQEPGVRIEPMVRLAPSPEAGILETVREERAHVVVLGWSGDQVVQEVDREPVVGPVIRSAPCEVVVLRGVLSGTIENLIVPVSGGPHAPAALNLGEALVHDCDCQIVALNIVRGTLTPDKESQAMDRLRQAVADSDDPEKVELRVVNANQISKGILKEAAEFDLLLLGASQEGLLALNFFGGLPTRIAQERTKPTILVKRFEGFSHFWFRRFWQLLSDQMPALTQEEKTGVYAQMGQAARADISFYILIFLSSMIAYLGLIQGSSAVIIGAMLVAPLMSPILAMAHSIVQGNLRLFRRATESTIKGVALAIGTSIALTVILPQQSPTVEILSRTQPNILDLIIALASGAAAAYAMSRKTLAAALPGVAIAAALVPPLCVVGYGLGSAQFQIANGALLLFTTNLSAIILAGAITFLLVGFRPPRAEYGQRMQTGIIIAVVVLIIIAIPLGFTSVISRQKIQRVSQVESTLEAAIEELSAFVQDISVEQRGDQLLIEVTIYDFGQFDSRDLDQIRQEISDLVGIPVIIHATVIPASFEESSGGPAALESVSP